MKTSEDHNAFIMNFFEVVLIGFKMAPSGAGFVPSSFSLLPSG